MVPRVGLRWPGGLNIEVVSSKGLLQWHLAERNGAWEKLYVVSMRSNLS